MEHLLQEFKDCIVAASANKTALRFRGGGTKDWYGQKLQGGILDTRGFSGIVDYEPTELVITVRCGTPLSEVEAVLAEHHQMLAFEPPHFGEGATIGGVVAAGLSGPRRQAVGAVRDFVLGASMMNGQGEIVHFGGQVMKNVAGYDVSRLLAGSLGTLGLILDVSLKVLPKPFYETTVRLLMSEANAIRCLNEWGGQPMPITASAWHRGVLLVRLAGAEAAVKAAQQKIGGEALDDADWLWAGLREQSNPFFPSLTAEGKGAALWRLSVPSTAVPVKLPGDQLIEWGGAQRWLKSEADPKAIRLAAEKIGGHASLFKGGDKRVGVFHPLAPAIAKIHRHLKNTFDPSDIFNRGRMYADF
jgi:glycolate oxidase FAD binding subunit